MFVFVSRNIKTYHCENDNFSDTKKTLNRNGFFILSKQVYLTVTETVIPIDDTMNLLLQLGVRTAWHLEFCWSLSLHWLSQCSEVTRGASCETRIQHQLLLVAETNRYYNQYLNTFDSDGRRSRLPDVTVHEMNVFLAIIMQMGHDVSDTLKSYWATAEQSCTQFYSETMKRDRFYHIL